MDVFNSSMAVETAFPIASPHAAAVSPATSLSISSAMKASARTVCPMLFIIVCGSSATFINVANNSKRVKIAPLLIHLLSSRYSRAVCPSTILLLVFNLSLASTICGLVM
ncbi:hypothetical protein R3P38DRAFT_2934495 [Favolaschia claudopus]|uniref:Uncharacterized protein n=1 Tax=Favolaschia claudopus TaxID=2862362 RepID=A0AAW0BRC5_9AGAR